MKNQLNRELIESLSESNNQQFLKQINNTIFNLMSMVVEGVSMRSPFIRAEKCVLLPVNEIYLGAVSQLSEYDYFLGVENPQIEFNSKNKKNFWKIALREFKASWRLGRKKYKKEKEARVVDTTIDKYKIADFRHDVVKQLAELLTPTSLISEHRQYVSIKGRDDFGANVKINIYVCVYDSHNNTFKLLNEVKNKYTIVDFGDRFKNLDYKKEPCGENFVKMVTILNALYSKNYNKIPNQILVESLVYNCPNLLFDKKDVYQTFINVINYVRLANPRDIVSICNANKNIFEEPLILGRGSQMEFSKIISMLDAFKY